MTVFDHREMYETLIVSEGARIRYKDQALVMRILGGILFWNRSFMTNFTTTVGNTIYFPSQKWVEADYLRAWTILSHELVHVEDYEKNRFFVVLYMLPQLLSVFSILALVLQTWWPLLFLAFLAPLPAPWRRKAEMRGYAMTMATQFWTNRMGISQLTKDDISKFFTGPDYYWMWPFKQSTAREVGRWSRMILCNEILDQGAIYGRVQSMIKARFNNSFRS